MPLVIRQFEANDQDAVIRLDRLSLGEVDAAGLPEVFDDLSNIDDVYLRSGEFIVAERDGELVGMGAIRYLDDNTAKINRMRVHPDYQRQGIASAMLDWLLLRAEENRSSRIILNTLKDQTRAQALYESKGFQRIGEGSPDGFDVVMYEKL